MILFWGGKIWRNKKQNLSFIKHINKSHLSKIPYLCLCSWHRKPYHPLSETLGMAFESLGLSFLIYKGMHLIIFKTASHSTVNCNCIALIHICRNQFVLLASYSPSKDLGDWNAERVSFLLGKAECHKERLELVGAIQRNNFIQCEHTYLIFSKNLLRTR